MRSGPFQAGLIFAALIMGTFLTLEGENLGKQFGVIEGDPVLVFVVPLPKNAERIRLAVSPERILWEGEAGFATVGDRVITTSFDRAGEIIKGAGWIDRPIQIVTLSADPDDEAEDEAGRSKHPMTRAERRERLLGLVNQPTLSAGEQMFVLAAMNDGIAL